MTRGTMGIFAAGCEVAYVWAVYAEARWWSDNAVNGIERIRKRRSHLALYIGLFVSDSFATLGVENDNRCSVWHRSPGGLVYYSGGERLDWAASRAKIATSTTWDQIRW